MIFRRRFSERRLGLTVTAAFISSLQLMSFSPHELLISDVTVGENLEAGATVGVSEPAGAGGLAVTVVSSDPTRVLLSATPESAGSASIVLSIPQGYKQSHEFYVQALAAGKNVTLTASAPGMPNRTAVAKIGRSGVVMRGPSGPGAPILTTPRSDSLKITVTAALFDESGAAVSSQPVAGGRSFSVTLSSSSENVGRLAAPQLTIAGGTESATTRFQPAGVGKTTLAAALSGSGAAPMPPSTIPAEVISPGMGVLDDATLGHNLQVPGSLTLGEPAPAGGLEVRLTSSDPSRLLLSTSDSTPGSESITILIPAGASTGSYFVSSLGDQGEVTYVATAPGYRSRIGHLRLAPSGVVIGILPPDEAEVFRKEAAEEAHGFVARLSSNKGVDLKVYMVQLDPVTHRGADITLQRLRAGLSVIVEIKSSDTSVATLPSRVTVSGGSTSAEVPFTPSREGETMISVVTPEGFTTAKNSTSLKAIVKQ